MSLDIEWETYEETKSKTDNEKLIYIQQATPMEERKDEYKGSIELQEKYTVICPQ